MVAFRSSYVSFLVVWIVNIAFPAQPLSGYTLHQLSERVFMMEAFQLLLAVNSIFVSPPSESKQ